MSNEQLKEAIRLARYHAALDMIGKAKDRLRAMMLRYFPGDVAPDCLDLFQKILESAKAEGEADALSKVMAEMEDAERRAGKQNKGINRFDL